MPVRLLHRPAQAVQVLAAADREVSSRISGPLIDRIDIHIEVPPVPYRELRGKQDGSDSAAMREQVLRAREVQQHRFGEASTTLNARMSSPKSHREQAPSSCSGW